MLWLAIFVPWHWSNIWNFGFSCVSPLRDDWRTSPLMMFLSFEALEPVIQDHSPVLAREFQVLFCFYAIISLPLLFSDPLNFALPWGNCFFWLSGQLEEFLLLSVLFHCGRGAFFLWRQTKTNMYIVMTQCLLLHALMDLPPVPVLHMSLEHYGPSMCASPFVLHGALWGIASAWTSSDE